MVVRHPILIPALLILLFVLGCGDKEESPVGSDKYRFEDAGGEGADLAREARIEGDTFLELNKTEAARESHRRAYQYAKEALAHQESAEGRSELLDFLAHLAVDIGRYYRAPDYLGLAVVHSNERLRENPDLFLPRVRKGIAYLSAGMLLPAAQIFQELLALNLKPFAAEIVKKNLTATYYEMAKRVLLEDAVGARALAARALKEAMRVRPLEGGDDVDKLWKRLMEHYATEANEKKDDPLALARIHSRYGFADPLGAENLVKAVKEHGRTPEVRWVEARYVEEMDGRPEAIEKAAEHYLELMSRSDRAPFAAAGLGRVLHTLGRHEEALTKLAGFTDLTGEMRRILVLLHLARIEKLDEEDKDRQEEEFQKVEDLLSGDIAAEIRGRLLTRIGLTALSMRDRTRLSWAIRELRRRSDEDPRIYVLDAELRELEPEEDGD